MARLTYPTECRTSAIMPPKSDTERHLELKEEMATNLRYALIRDMVVLGNYSPKRACSSVHADVDGDTIVDREARTTLEDLYAIVWQAYANGFTHTHIGEAFAKFARAALENHADLLADAALEGQRIAFGARK